MHVGVNQTCTLNICTNFTTCAAVQRTVPVFCCVLAWQKVSRQFSSHHLWPPVEPWRGYCLQRSGPGRYSNQHLPAAQMRWWGLRWATPRSDCWAAGVGWERANSAGRETNSQLVRTWNQYNLENHHQTHTHTAHTRTHGSDYLGLQYEQFLLSLG